jgi:ribosomal protein S18 acetylase RimI-like enzyme
MMVTIRPAVPSDEAALLALTPRLAAFALPAWRTAGEIAAADHRILLDALHRPEGSTSILVASAGEPGLLGYVFSSSRTDYFTGERHGHVEVLTLAPEAEGRGLARRLMEAAESWALGRGYRRMTLNVFATNTRARGLYDRLGYGEEIMRYVKDLPAGGRS